MIKVLILENDAMIADYLEEILNDSGYKVCGIAGDVDSAIQLGEACKPDIGLIDLRLADGRFGTEVAAALCVRPDCGILYSTGNPDHAMLHNAVGTAVLAKPYTPEALVAALRLVRAHVMREVPLPRQPKGFTLLH
jgi:DNA-binding response OmpR family regulator